MGDHVADLLLSALPRVRDAITNHFDKRDYLFGDATEEEPNLLATVIATPDPIGSAPRTWFPPLLF